MTTDSTVQTNIHSHELDTNERSVGRAMWRGLLCHCPNCNSKGLFKKYLKSTEHCSNCGEVMSHHRADDFPPYLTIFIVGHIVVALVLIVERSTALTLWMHLAIWLPLTVILSLLMLQPLKGAVIGLQWALRMHGFSGNEDNASQ